MNLILDVVSSSHGETLSLGERIIKELPKNINLIIINGDLGSGKTVLVKGMARALNIKEEIISPTYGYKKDYYNLIHYDFYLMKKIKSKNLYSLISEDLEKNLVVVEWGGKLPKIENTLFVRIKVLDKLNRSIKVWT